MEQTMRSSSATAAGDKAGIHEFVSRSLSRAVPKVEAPLVASTERVSGASAEISRLPESGPKVASLEITPNGVKIGNVDREISFAELWTERVKGLQERLSAEEIKTEKDRDLKRINELRAAIAEEKAFLAHLSNEKSAGHAVAVKRAQEMMHSFRPSAAELERLANERGPGGAVRGRVVAMATLFNAFIALKAKGN